MEYKAQINRITWIKTDSEPYYYFIGTAHLEPTKAFVS